MANRLRVELMLDKFDPNVLVCTEARVTNEIMESEITMVGYNVIRSNSASRRSGGVIIYIRAGTKYKLILNDVVGYDHIVVYDIESGPCRGRWFSIYHSPNASHSVFLDHFESVYDDNSTAGQLTYVNGDFNINMLDTNQHSTYKQRLLRFQINYSMKLLVHRPTRVTQLSKTLIDLFFTNDRSVKVEVRNDVMIADHNMVVMKKSDMKRNYDKICVTDRSACTFEAVANNIKRKLEIDDFQSLNLDDRTKIIHEAIETGVNDLTKKKSVTISYSKRWYTQELCDLRREESRCHLRAQIVNDSLSWEEYRRTRNIYNRKMKEAKNNEIKNILTSCNDQRKLWKEIKKLYNNNTPPPDYINFDGQLLCDTSTIADNFNIYFVESIKQLNESIPFVQYSPNITEMYTTPWAEFELTTIEEVNRILKDMKKKSGINNVNKDMILAAMSVCGQEIVEIFNQSFRTGVFPSMWKFTEVLPIPKVSRTNKASEFRPINNAHPFDKTIQSIVKKQLENHIHRNNILVDEQSAFRRHHSCETALNLVILKWKEARMKKKVIIAVFLDLQRAFETVDRELLCVILENYGIQGNVLKWFKSWLIGRRQQTRFKDSVSGQIANDIGIPQGTPLSCLLFILNINDLPKIVRYCLVNLFADDTLLTTEHEDPMVAAQLMNEDLQRISQYFASLKLKLNVNKTKYMVIGSENNNMNFNITIGGVEIERVSVMKYLGVKVDDQLNFDENNEFVAMKMSKKIAFLGRNKNKMDRDTRLRFFKTIVMPHIDYCSSILFLSNESQFNRLQKLQNRAMRLILGEGRRAHIDDMLNATELLDIKQRVYLNVLLLMYKATQNLLPDYLCEQLRWVSDSQPYSLRQNRLLRPPSYRTAAAQNSFIYKGSQLFNEMLRTIDIVGISMKQFKEEATEFVKMNIASHRIL